MNLLVVYEEPVVLDWTRLDLDVDEKRKLLGSRQAEEEWPGLSSILAGNASCT